MRRSINNMVVVITGASSGIGRSLAQQLAGRGAKLVLAARRYDRLAMLNASLGGTHLCKVTDVSEPEDCVALIRATVETFGRVDTLICNAGYGLIRPILETDSDEILHIMKTNLIGTTECCRAAVSCMLAQPPRDNWQGQIVIVSSASARRGLPDFGAYTATKAAQLSIAEAMRVELRHTGMSVTTVHPITTTTEFFKTAIRLSGVRPPQRCGIESFQSAEAVASAIISAMEKPRPEVWPNRRARLLLGLAAFLPGIADSILARRRKRRSRRLVVPVEPVDSVI